MSEAALRVRREAAKKRRGGLTVFQAVKIPKALLISLEDMKGSGEPYWKPIERAVKVLTAVHAMRKKLSSQGDPDIKGLVKLLEEHDDGDKA